MPLPGDGGFAESAPGPHLIVVRQAGCEQLLLVTFINGHYHQDPRLGPAVERDIPIDLTPARGRKVRWGPHSVFWRQKFIPAGMRFFFPRAFMELELTRLEDGSLEYFLRQEEHGRTIGQIRCRWPRVEEGEPDKDNAAPPGH